MGLWVDRRIPTWCGVLINLQWWLLHLLMRDRSRHSMAVLVERVPWVHESSSTCRLGFMLFRGSDEKPAVPTVVHVFRGSTFPRARRPSSPRSQRTQSPTHFLASPASSRCPIAHHRRRNQLQSLIIKQKRCKSPKCHSTCMPMLVGGTFHPTGGVPPWVK